MQETKRNESDPWVREILWRRAWQSTPVFLPGESHGQRSLAGYSSQGRKESDTTDATQHACMHALGSLVHSQSHSVQFKEIVMWFLKTKKFKKHCSLQQEYVEGRYKWPLHSALQNKNYYFSLFLSLLKNIPVFSTLNVSNNFYRKK